jgi:hypothetical protein
VAVTRAMIRAVPWDARRAASARKLREQTGGTIVWDSQHHAYETFLDALFFAAAIGDVIHMEDDVQLTSGWRGKAEAVIAAHREDVIQFFSMRGADLTTGSRTEPGRTFLMAQCFYVPARLAGPLAEFAPGWIGREADPTGVDLAVRAFLVAEGATYHLHVPSLVQHHRWRSAINPRRGSGRQSRSFEP